MSPHDQAPAAPHDERPAPASPHDERPAPADPHDQAPVDPDDERPAPEIRVRQRVSPAELAALVAALRGPAAGAPGTGGPPARHAPPWLRAGLREGLGGRPAEQPSDLR